MLLLRKGWHQSYFIKTSHISNSLIRIRIDYDAIRQKYLHTVNFPSLSIVLNSPDDSLLNLLYDAFVACNPVVTARTPQQEEGCYPKCEVILFSKNADPSPTASKIFSRSHKQAVLNAHARSEERRVR